MPRPIPYWDTKVDPAKTAREIVDLLVKYGAQETSVEWADSVPLAVRFRMKDKGSGIVLPVRIEARIEPVAKLLRTRGHSADTTRVRRIVWRHLKDLTEQQLLAADIGQFSLVDVFLANVAVQTPAGFTTFGEWAIDALQHGQLPQGITGQLLLPSAKPDDGT